MRTRALEAAGRVGHTAIAGVLFVIAGSILRLDSVPVPLALAILSIGLLAVVRPDAALLVVAAIVPVAAHMLRRWDPGVAWAETMVVAFAAGWCARRAVWPEQPGLPSRLRLPLIVFGSVVCASAAVQMSVEYVRLGSGEFAGFILQYLSRDFFVSGSVRYLQLGAFLLAGLLLFSAAARLALADRQFAWRLAGTLVVSAAGAAAINFQHLILSALRFDEAWRVLAHDVATARFNLHYADANAAGSVFAMFLFVAFALAAARRRSRVLYVPAVALLAAGLWISGSRTALLATALAAGVLAGALVRRQMDWRGRLLTTLAGIVLAVGVIAVIYAPTRGNQKVASIAARVRIEMAQTTLRMVSSSPFFGIGLGEFYQRSGEYSSPELLALFPPAHHENAHNNFFQVLAEMGVIGLGAFLWLLMAGMHVARWPLRAGRDALAWGSLAGLTAFLLTCLGGHPLLTREAAYAFWMLLGLAAGNGLHDGPRPGQAASRKWLTVATVIIVAALVISIPTRVENAKAHADFEHLGIGVSRHWQTSEDGVRYRSAVMRATLFVPRTAGFRFRVRTLSERDERLELRFDGRLADVVLLPPGRWTDIAVPARSVRPEGRFARMDVRILDAPGETAAMWITKVEQLGF